MRYSFLIAVFLIARWGGGVINVPTATDMFLYVYYYVVLEYPYTPPHMAIRNTLGGPDTQFLIFRDSENGFPR